MYFYRSTQKKISKVNLEEAKKMRGIEFKWLFIFVKISERNVFKEFMPVNKHAFLDVKKGSKKLLKKWKDQVNFLWSLIHLSQCLSTCVLMWIYICTLWVQDLLFFYLYSLKLLVLHSSLFVWSLNEIITRCSTEV